MKTGKENVQWTTPSGFYCVQEYREPLYKQIQTYAAGGAHYEKLNLAVGEVTTVETGEGDPKLSKNASAIAANFTHSLDGSIMQLGLTDVDPSIDMYTVHDCLYCLQKPRLP